MNKIKDDHIKVLREYYVSNPNISLSELADYTTNLIGFKVNLETLKQYSSKEKWSVLRANKGKNTGDVSINDKLVVVSDKLYELIMDEENPLPGTSIAQISRTWFDMVTKAGMNKTSSAKTSAQAVKDLIAKMQAEDNG